MNVMAQAHNMTRQAMAKTDKSVCVITYKQAFSVYLRAAHQEYKAMQKEEALALLQADTIAQFEKRISELQAVKETPLADKWIVTCGGLPVDFDAPNQAWPWANVETCSTWNSPQFARAYAQKIRNGAGEFGKAVSVIYYCTAEIEKLVQLITGIKSAK